MKKIHFIFTNLLLLLTFSSCYEDLGNYSYKKLDELNIELASSTYNKALGQTLKIVPTITTSIDTTDLTYLWEVYGLASGSSYSDFVKFAEGKTLNYQVGLSELMPSLSSYSFRLHVIQKSTGRQFYSSTLTLTIDGLIKGLMVFHGDDTQSDIGLITAHEFMALSTDTMSTTTVIPAYYSLVNNKKIAGKAKSICQYIPDNMSSGASGTAVAQIVAITDKGAAIGSYSTISYGGDWNSMFYGNLNKGKPEYFQSTPGYGMAVDSGQLFIRQIYFPFSIPDSISYYYYVASPICLPSNTALMQAMFFDKNSRGFIGVKYFWNVTGSRDLFPITTSSPFNAANMQANLLHIDNGGTGTHYMAVMETDAGAKFVAELYPGQVKQSKVSYAKYDMSSLPDIDNAKYFAFGTGLINMCYYATPTAVYRYSASIGTALSAEKLKTTAGDEISFGNETVTMMRILKPDVVTNPGYSYFNANKMLIVGTYGGSAGTGKIYSLLIDQLTGRVKSYNTYTGFDRISDANIKGI